MPFFRRIGLKRLPVMTDSFLLRVRALLRRARVAGLGRLGKIAVPERKIVYIDAGLHRNAAQIASMLEWFAPSANLRVYGIEAHPRYMRECRFRFGGERRVRLFNYALVGPDHAGDTATLYLDGNKGLGNSLFAARGKETIEVPAIRLSKLIREHEIAEPGDILILRMNIEGAEMQVIEDLAEAGMIGLFDGFYGMWDDLYKIDPALDGKFRALLKRERIKSFTFNDRDTSPIAGPKRREIIRYDIETSIYRGEKRKPEEMTKWKIRRRDRLQKRSASVK
ncbi:MAG TPA: FkbM family methyltransferase [Rhizomicrobium sp.]|nr:FkbM family methyltransferase [Rhizomicrobium sp.]